MTTRCWNLSVQRQCSCGEKYQTRGVVSSQRREPDGGAIRTSVPIYKHADPIVTNRGRFLGSSRSGIWLSGFLSVRKGVYLGKHASVMARLIASFPSISFLGKLYSWNIYSGKNFIFYETTLVDIPTSSISSLWWRYDTSFLQHHLFHKEMMTS